MQKGIMEWRLYSTFELFEERLLDQHILNLSEISFVAADKHCDKFLKILGCFVVEVAEHLLKLKHWIPQRYANFCGCRIIEQNFVFRHDNDPKRIPNSCGDYTKFSKLWLGPPKPIWPNGLLGMKLMVKFQMKCIKMNKNCLKV